MSWRGLHYDDEGLHYDSEVCIIMMRVCIMIVKGLCSVQMYVVPKVQCSDTTHARSAIFRVPIYTYICDCQLYTAVLLNKQNESFFKS